MDSLRPFHRSSRGLSCCPVFNFLIFGFLCAVVVLGMALSSVGSLQAADLYVSEPGGDDGWSGLSWAEAKQTIEAALDEANLTPEADTIHVGQGEYVRISPLDVEPDIELLGGYDETTGLRDPQVYASRIRIRDWGYPETYGFQLSSRTALDGFSIEAFNAFSNIGEGVIVQASSAEVTIQNNRFVNFKGNTPTLYFLGCEDASGGSVKAIVVHAGCSSLDIERNVFEDVQGGGGWDSYYYLEHPCPGGSAGAIAVEGPVAGCTISGNVIHGVHGGKGGDSCCSSCDTYDPVPGSPGSAIVVGGGHDVLIADNDIEDCTGGAGGYGWNQYDGSRNARGGDATGIVDGADGVVSANRVAYLRAGGSGGDCRGIVADAASQVQGNEVFRLRAGGSGYGVTAGDAFGLTASRSDSIIQHNAIGLIQGGSSGGGAYGISVSVGTSGMEVFDNLVFDVLGSGHWTAGIEANHASGVIRNNTVARVSNAGDLGEAAAAYGLYMPSAGDQLVVENNILAEITGEDDGITGTGGGFGIHAAGSEPAHAHNTSFGCSHADYDGLFLPGPTDTSEDPLFAERSGFGLCFYLSAPSCGQTVSSAAIDTGSAPADSLGLDTRTTCAEGTPDAGTVDRGYHYAVDAAFDPGGRIVYRGTLEEFFEEPLPVLTLIDFLPYYDTAPVFEPPYPPLLLYRVSEVATIRLTKTGAIPNQEVTLK